MRRIAMVGLVGLLCLVGCKSNMAPSEAGNPNGMRRVLIAGEDTAFKRKLAAKVIEELGTPEWYFRIIGLNQLAEQETGQYGAIVLAAGYRAGRIDERVSTFLRKDPENPKVIVFYTRGAEGPMPDWAKAEIRVDSVSSASRDDRVELRAGQLAALIEERF